MNPTPKLACAAVACAIAALAQAQQRPYQSVTDARLASPEPENWLSYCGNYSGWGYSALSKISNKNVGKLTLAWSYTTGLTEGHQSPPIVNGGYMYVTTPGSQVIALDAKTGNEIWRYKPQIPGEQLQLHPDQPRRGAVRRRLTWPPSTASSSHSMRRPARRCGRPRSTSGRTATT
jgi:alcohol dehydrogenase (cytochrome c)